ncbi:MAG: GFA family protein [Rhodobiaceae bacterium]|nr:GFA family protein [Rhodobiaceae bacterium]
MAMKLEGSCRCGAVRFAVDSHTPYPYQRCYCSICRKQDGGGGYAINVMGDSETLEVEGREAIGIYRVEISDNGSSHFSSAERNFCMKCGTALWLYDPNWPQLVYPFASAIDTDLPVPPSHVHLMLDFAASWVEVQDGPGDQLFPRYPKQSIEDWHKSRGLWID